MSSVACACVGCSRLGDDPPNPSRGHRADSVHHQEVFPRGGENGLDAAELIEQSRSAIRADSRKSLEQLQLRSAFTPGTVNATRDGASGPCLRLACRVDHEPRRLMWISRTQYRQSEHQCDRDERTLDRLAPHVRLGELRQGAFQYERRSPRVTCKPSRLLEQPGVHDRSHEIYERLSLEYEDVIDKIVTDGQMLHTDIDARHRSKGVEHA